jgi:hypothetical protein
MPLKFISYMLVINTDLGAPGGESPLGDSTKRVGRTAVR